MAIGFMTTYAECIAFTPSVYMCIQFVPTESHTGSTGMSLAQPLPPHNANRSSARRISAENAEDSESNWSIRPNLHETPEKEKLPQLPLTPQWTQSEIGAENYACPGAGRFISYFLRDSPLPHHPNRWKRSHGSFLRSL